MQKNRKIEMDMMRGLAILAVVLIHVTSGVMNTTSNIENLNLIYLITNQLSRFAVPVFLFLSGLGLSLSDRKESYFSFLKRRVSKILPLYFIWSAIYYILSDPTSFNLSEFAQLTLNGDNYYHLYYVVLIIMFYLLYPLFKRIAQNKTGMISILAVTILVQISAGQLDFSVFTSNLNLLNWSVYFVLGIWFANNYQSLKDQFKKYKRFITPLFILTSIGIVIESYSYFNIGVGTWGSTTDMRPTIIFYTIVFVAFIMSLNWKQNQTTLTLSYLSKFSYEIYLSHAFVLYFWRNITDYFSFETNSIFYLLLSTVIVIALSIVLSKGINIAKEKIDLLKSSRKKLRTDSK